MTLSFCPDRADCTSDSQQGSWSNTGKSCLFLQTCTSLQGTIWWNTCRRSPVTGLWDTSHWTLGNALESSLRNPATDRGSCSDLVPAEASGLSSVPPLQIETGTREKNTERMLFKLTLLEMIFGKNKSNKQNWCQLQTQFKTIHVQKAKRCLF